MNPVAKLLLGLCLIVCIVVGLDHLSGEVTLIEHNRQLDVEVDAYFYTEVVDLEEFLDNRNGRYGKRAVSHVPAYRAERETRRPHLGEADNEPAS